MLNDPVFSDLVEVVVAPGDDFFQGMNGHYERDRKYAATIRRVLSVLFFIVFITIILAFCYKAIAATTAIKTVLISWTQIESVADGVKLCQEMGALPEFERVGQCVLRSQDGSACTVVTRVPKDQQDDQAIFYLGHEMCHCYGDCDHDDD